jgi:hypothetical protein
MPRFRVAHLRERGVNLVIVPLESHFGDMSPKEQRQVIGELQRHSLAARLAGTVVPVWPQGRSMAFIAPTNWHPFFKSLGLNDVLASVNKELSW